VERKHVVLSPWDPRKGAKEAKVTIVEFCDFECPYCLELAPKLRKIEAERGKDVAVVFKTMPLTNVHEHAMGAALAFQAAHRQGKAWALHDKMFANQGALTKPDIEKYARELHLDMARFHKDMSDPKVKEEVDADAKQEGPLGVCCYTPRVFINGRLVNAQMKLEGYEAIVDEEIKNAEELVEAGTPLADVYRKFTEH
jgi:protein-disulfide isomerase